MRQVFLKTGKIQLLNVDLPLSDQNSIIVRVNYSFISSGTEFATISNSGKSLWKKVFSNLNQNIQKVSGAIKDNGFSATLALINEKMEQVIPLGYSCSGQVVEVGQNVEGFVVGDYVACAGANFANHADFVVVPQNLAVKIRNCEMLKQVSLTTIGAIAMQGVRRANLELGQKVCVFGLGLLGQLTVQLAKLSGCQVFGIDIQESRLRLAHELGADSVFNPMDSSIIKEIEFATSQRGVDVTIITAVGKDGIIIQQAMQATRRKGKVVLVGDVKIDFDRDPFYSKEIDFLISCSYGPGRYDDAYEKRGVDYPYDYVRWTENRNMELFARLVQEKKILIEPLISSEFDIKDVESAYNLLQTRSSLGIILSYGSAYQCEATKINPGNIDSKNVKKFIPASPVNIGFIGVGGFSKIKLLPIVSKIKNINIHSMVDSNSTTLVNVSNLYKVQSISNNYKELLDTGEVNAVVIATPHCLHADQAIDFMSAGKAVFVEKPAAVNFEQFEKLKSFLNKNNDVLYCVDFNRSFSPFIQKIKEMVKKRNNPMMIHYRMNAGLIPRDHWIYSPANGGRIIGEACHIFELFCFLTDAEPVSISVESINSNNDAIKKADNFIAKIRMNDGSCCSLLYTSIGNAESGKEYMEIFFDGKSIIMNDFYELKGFGLSKNFNQVSRVQDKGHEDILKRFFSAVQAQNYQPPVSYKRILTATEISLIVADLISAGGGFKSVF